MDRDIGEGGDDLLLWWKVCALLELEISDRAREGEVAIDATEVYEATRGAYPCLLACGVCQRSFGLCKHHGVQTLVLGLVVKGQRLRSALDAKDGPGIASVALHG